MVSDGPFASGGEHGSTGRAGPAGWGYGGDGRGGGAAVMRSGEWARTPPSGGRRAGHAPVRALPTEYADGRDAGGPGTGPQQAVEPPPATEKAADVDQTADEATAGLARRLQSRLERHTALLAQLRARTLSPACDTTELVELEESARRLQRDATSLLLLTGHDPQRPESSRPDQQEPAPRRLADVLAAAVTAAEEPHRVTVRPTPGPGTAAAIGAAAAIEVQCVLAELIDHVTAVYPGARLVLAVRRDDRGSTIDLTLDGPSRHDPDGLGGRRAAVAAEALARRSRSGITLRRPAGGATTGSAPVAGVHCPAGTVTLEAPAPAADRAVDRDLDFGGDFGRDFARHASEDRSDTTTGHDTDQDAAQPAVGEVVALPRRNGRSAPTVRNGTAGPSRPPGTGGSTRPDVGPPDRARPTPRRPDPLSDPLPRSLLDPLPVRGYPEGPDPIVDPAPLPTPRRNGSSALPPSLPSTPLPAPVTSALTSLPPSSSLPPVSSTGRVDELFGPLLDLPIESLDEQYAATPIFESIASAWFVEDAAATGPDRADGGAPEDWRTPQDEEWRAAAARAAAPEPPSSTTTSGLPRRRPGGQLVPPPRTVRRASTPPAPSTEREPDKVRDRLSTYQRGLRQGRHRAPASEGTEPDPWT